MYEDPGLVHLVRTRYHGIHLAGSATNIHMDTRVEGVHWMNFLGQPVLGRLGVGDVEAGQTLPLHRALARVLEPHLYQSTARRWLEDWEEQCRWERRFLE